MFYTYAHITSDTNRIFYIGKGSGNRLLRKDARNKHWHNTVLKHGYKATKLATWKTEKEAFEHEKLLISCFKDMGYKLVNQSAGGDGNGPQGGLSFKGKKHNKESIEKCRMIHKGIAKSKEHNLKNSEAHKKKVKVDGIIYPSWSDASKSTGIPIGSIRYLIKCKPTTGKWAKFTLESVL